MVYAHGGDIYRNPGVLDFSVNLNPLGMPPGVAEAVKAGDGLWGCYPDARCQELAEALAGFHGLPAGQLLCGNGAADLIFQLVQALRPKHAMVLAPSFSEYEQALKGVGCQVSHFFLKKEEGFRPHIGRLIRQLPKDCELLFFCNPNNPSGAAVPAEELGELADACSRRGIRLVADECFVELLEEPKRYSLLPRTVRDPNLFVLRAFTKTYAMAGLRLGYGVCGDRVLLERMNALRQPWSVSVPAQQAGVAALKEVRYLEESRRLIARQREALTEGLSGLGFEVFPSQANFVLFYDKKESRHERLGARLLEEGILIRDCKNYFGLSEGYYRVCVKQEADQAHLLRALGRIVQE